MTVTEARPVVRVVHGDSLAVLRTLRDASVDAIVTDPPYGLAAHSVDNVARALVAWLSGDRTHVPDGKGFMGKAWDGFVPPPGVFDECRRVLKPGGHLLCFAGSRTADLMGISIRMAGFEIRDAITWLYASGFPKSADVSKAIDKAAGATREVIGSGQYAARGRRTDNQVYGQATPSTAEVITAPATDAAGQWAGWGTALKPASEPILVARKPLAGTVAANVQLWGTGAINIDGCRVAHAGAADLAESLAKNPGRTDSVTSEVYGADRPQQSVNVAGRWPANVVLSHAEADGVDLCEDGCVDGCPVAELDSQSGISSSTGGKGAASAATKNGAVYGDYPASTPGEWSGAGGYGDRGGASRFFPTFRYQAKASPSERPKVDGIAHPTVKPLTLMRWLVRLVTPPDGVVLDPFAGSGTTVEAALLEGFGSIAVERDAGYLPLIQARIDRASKSGTLF